jgi:hypothetical protein
MIQAIAIRAGTVSLHYESVVNAANRAVGLKLRVLGAFLIGCLSILFPMSGFATTRTVPYPNVDGRHLGQIGAVKEKLPPETDESIPLTLQILGDQCFFKGDYAGAESYYLRSISVCEAENRRIYGREEEPTILPAKTADDAVQRYKSIKSLTVDAHPNSGYSIVIDAAKTLHFLALIEDLKGSYAEGDRLFRAAYRRHMFASDESCPPFPPSFGPDVNVEYAENGYKQMLSKVVSKFGSASPYAATRLEQLAMFYDSQPQWAFSEGVEQGVKYTQERLKQEIARYPYTEERAQKVQTLLQQAISIRQNVKTAYDPEVLEHDIRRTHVSTYHNVTSSTKRP